MTEDLKIERPYKLGHFDKTYVRWHDDGRRQFIQSFRFDDREVFLGQYEFRTKVRIGDQEGEGGLTREIEFDNREEHGALTSMSDEDIWSAFDDKVEEMREEVETQIRHQVFQAQMQQAQMANANGPGPRRPNLKAH